MGLFLRFGVNSAFLVSQFTPECIPASGMKTVMAHEIGLCFIHRNDPILRAKTERLNLQ